MKYLFLLPLLLFLFPSNSYGCSCLVPPSFCESIVDNKGNISPTSILRGKVLGSNSEGKEVEVRQVIYGYSDKSNFTLISGMCTLYFNELEDNSEYVFALNKSKEYGILVGCAISFLKIENENVVGKIAPGIGRIAYNELSAMKSCGIAFNQLNLKSHLNIFPNPTADYLSISNTSGELKFEGIQLNIFDSSGRTLAEHKNIEGILPKEEWEINIQNFVSGLYFVEVINGYQKAYYKIVKI